MGNIEEAILKLAELIDYLENDGRHVPVGVQPRRELIKSILEGSK